LRPPRGETSVVYGKAIKAVLLTRIYLIYVVRRFYYPQMLVGKRKLEFLTLVGH